ESAVGEHGVEGLDRMAFALDVTIAVWIFARFRSDAEHAVVEDVQDVEAGQPAAGMTGAGMEDRFEHSLAQAEGFQFQFAIVHDSHAMNPARKIGEANAEKNILTANE